MNDHAKHIVCFMSSEISMYLTKIPELSANCVYSAVNVYIIVNEMLNCILSDIRAINLSVSPASRT